VVRGGGVLFSSLIAAALASMVWGPVKDVKLWFIAVCWEC
jgi:hypothetical protein